MTVTTRARNHLFESKTIFQSHQWSLRKYRNEQSE